MLTADKDRAEYLPLRSQADGPDTPSPADETPDSDTDADFDPDLEHGDAWITASAAEQRRVKLRARLWRVATFGGGAALLLGLAGLATTTIGLPRAWMSVGEPQPVYDFRPDPITIFNDSTPAPQRYRLVQTDLQDQYVAGDILYLHVAGPGPEVDQASWLHLSIAGDGGQLFSGIPTRKPAHGWIVPLLEPGNYSLSVRLNQYNIPDYLDRLSPLLPGADEQNPPPYAFCYNDTVADGEMRFEVVPSSHPDVFARAQAGVRALPKSVRTREVEAIGTLAGQSCYHRSESLWGWWSSAEAPATYHAYSGCRTLSSVPEDARQFIEDLPDSPVRWIRTLGDSNTRFVTKDGLPNKLMLIPPGTYPPEQEVPGAPGTFPCIFGFNEKNGKDEQFMCLLFPKGSSRPIVFSMEWFTMADNDSEPIDVVYRRTLREAFRTSYHNATLLNDFFTGRFGHYDPNIFRHTVETLLAPWPEVLDLAYADHTLVSFGSHNTQATMAQWTDKLDNLTSIWPRSKYEPDLVTPDQPRREDLSFIYTTPVNTLIIPEKFGRQFLIRNNIRNEARNELAATYLASNGYLAEQTPSRDGVRARAHLLDFYGSMHAMLDTMHDAVHFQPHGYAVHAQLVLDHVILRAAGVP